MAKHTHPKTKKSKSTSATPAPVSVKSVNWHRVVWQLTKPRHADDHDNFYGSNFFHPASSNRFWLEPELYPGPPVTFGQGPALQQFDANSLCFRVRFLGNEMTAAWRDCLLFPRGSKPLQFGKNNKPQPVTETERLVGRTKIRNGEFAKLTVYMNTRKKPAELQIFASEIGIGSHLGMGVAHQ
jgi:hypothetical protein